MGPSVMASRVILSFGYNGNEKKRVKQIKATSVQAPLHAFDHFSFSRMHF